MHAVFTLQKSSKWWQCIYIHVRYSTSDVSSIFFFLMFLQFTIIYLVNSRYEIVCRKGRPKVRKDYSWGGQHSWPTRVSKQRQSISLALTSWYRAKRPSPSGRQIEEACHTLWRQQCWLECTRMNSVNNMNNNEQLTNCCFVREDNISNSEWLSLARISYLDQRGIPR